MGVHAFVKQVAIVVSGRVQSVYFRACDYAHQLEGSEAGPGTALTAG